MRPLNFRSIAVAGACAMLACSGGVAATVNFTTDGSTAWTIDVPSQGITNGTPDTGYIPGTITPFPGAGGCTSPTCTATFDGFWTANFTFSLPAGATGVSLNFSNLTADDRGVLELNGAIIGNTYIGGTTPATGDMVFTDGGTNGAYSFGGAASETGLVTTGFNIGGSNTLTMIVNNTESGPGGSLNPRGFTVAGVTGSVDYIATVAGVPEPGSALLIVSALAGTALLRRRAVINRRTQ